MWPRAGGEIGRAIGARAWSDDVERASISGIALGDRPAVAGEIFIALREGGHDGHELALHALASGARVAIVAADWAAPPDLASRLLVVDDTTRAFRALAALLRRDFVFPILAVGGSNGKTTTKEMLAALLGATKTPETMNGWTGIPLTLVQPAHAQGDLPAACVVEIGIDAKGAMAEHVALVRPDVAVLTALGAEHLEGLGSEEDAIREELILFDGSKTRVFQAEDPAIRARLSLVRSGDVVVAIDELAIAGASHLRFAVNGSDVDVVWRPASGDGWRARFHVPMPGRHNALNFASALGAALAAFPDKTPDELARAFGSFAPPSMRCEVRTFGELVVIDDAYNASPASMRAALDLLASYEGRRRIAILGDMLELGAASRRLHEAIDIPDGVEVRLFGTEMKALATRIGASCMEPADDPRALVEPLPVDAVVLVKGSRGMHLERVVGEIIDRATPHWSSLHSRFQSACVTGTNGKTTTTSLIGAIVEAAGETLGLVTTLGSRVGSEVTGEDPTVESFLRTIEAAAAQGVKTLAIETTSQALQECIAASWPPKVAVFTNLSRDHLDYHGTPEVYLAAKAQLFMNLPEGGVAVLNVADESSALLDEVTPKNVRRLGYAARAPHPDCANIPLVLAAKDVVVGEHGTRATLEGAHAAALGGRLELALVGAVHVENALGAALAGLALGYAPEAIRDAFARFAGVPGRFQIVHRAPVVVVDFAHTPDALERTLTLARALAVSGGRVWCVFGCGGDRDPGKRPQMGEIAARLADEVVITNDNPRSEDPERLADAVIEGTKGGAARVQRILDRRLAIECAVGAASPTDIVVIAGKGHEKTQLVADAVIAFDDAEVARSASGKRKA
jgi:UDP-N-acetylmuramoyl-L-alanyl-D-glutamate--2,6-diaminopimelate ligase